MKVVTLGAWCTRAFACLAVVVVVAHIQEVKCGCLDALTDLSSYDAVNGQYCDASSTIVEIA
eukprot:CAMPEP_0118797546 /NCGR_PEP_ID=MMETSP1161-20130426/87_1 /TAXON_ID=249345 /ORGANISM="Picochlorum oklahomensis, Strain CCMP2329" /LENGTH=61 /DNA_ID=CAMNT_0006724741 /DNA_START=129 /DNA_END=310 /DNA_ORIENTATION=-